jgi:hypothetical protein
MNWEEYLSNQQYLADNQGLRSFAEKFMLALKIKNISEGINVVQAIHVHSRLRSWQVNLPVEMGGATETVDVMNMVVAGDIETAAICLMYGTPDDMTGADHWISEERLEWMVDQLKRWLGWE